MIGGILKRDIDGLDRYWQVIPTVRETLFKKSKHAGHFNLTTADVKSAIFGHAEFTAFKSGVDKLFTKWKKANSPLSSSRWKKWPKNTAVMGAC